MGTPIPLGLLFSSLILFISLSYVFFTILLFVKEQAIKILHSTQASQLDSSWLQGVGAVTYVLSCFLMITRLEAVILYDGIFIAIYVASVLGNLVSLWFTSKRPRARQ